MLLLRMHGDPPFLFQIPKEHDRETQFLEEIFRSLPYDVIVFRYELHIKKLNILRNFQPSFNDYMPSKVCYVS